MARLKALELNEASPKARAALEGVQKNLGKAPNMMRTMANSPAVLDAYLGFSGNLAKSSISPKLREQMALAVGEVNGCQYCLAAHSTLGKMVGLGEEEIADSRQGVSPDRKTEAFLRFARKVVKERGMVSDEDVAAVRAAGAGDAEIAEIVAAVALNIFTNYFNHVADTDVDFPKVDPVRAPSCAC